MPDENPYAPPELDAQPHVAFVNGYRSISARVRLWVGIQGLHLALTVFFAFDWILYGLDQATLTDRFPEFSGLLDQAIQPVFWLAFLGFLLLLRETRISAGKFVDYSIPHSPASMIYWFFVPILSFWKPYQAVSVVWTASHPPKDERPRDNLLVKIWWMASIGAMLSSLLYSFAPEETPAMIASNGLDAWSTVMDILLLTTLSQRQDDCAAQLPG